MDVAPLKGSAAKVLLYLLLNPGAERSTAAIMKGIGTKDKKTVYDARDQLRELGFTDEYGNPTCAGMETIPIRYENPTDAGRKTLPEYENPSDMGMENLPEPEPPSVLQQMVEADRMPGDGDPVQVGSNFQKRRRVQLRLLAQAFGQLLPGKYPVSEKSLKELLVLTHDNAETIFDIIQTLAQSGKSIDYPPTYVKRILESEVVKSPHAVTSAPAASSPTVGTSEASDGVVLREWTKADEEKSRLLERLLIKAGKATEEDFH